MDYGTFRGILTVIILIIFIGIVAWAYSKKRKASFDEAANLVFDDKNKNKNRPRTNRSHNP